MKNRFGGRNELLNKIRNWANHYRSRTFGVRRGKVQSFSTATFSKSNYLEIIPPGVNKAKAVAELAQTLGVELSQVAALGDGENDVEMLKEVGLGIAMGNACDDAKAAAGWLTGTNDEGGVAQAVRRLMATGMA
jgi:hydroxymethylpyrimidine pyrophosphatase-like HAD family hydrolase